jgi:hypothetical protein
LAVFGASGRYGGMAYRYLDIALEDLTLSDVHLFCACGRYVTLGPEDWRRWPGASLHRIAARLRCKGCGQLGNIPEVRLTSASARFGHFGRAPMPGEGTSTAPIATTHPRRTSRRRRNWWLWEKCPACGRHYAPHVSREQIMARSRYTSDA